MLIGEAAPIFLEPLVVPLLMLAGLVVALGMAYLADAIVRALFGTVSGALGWIPYAGKVLSAPVHSIEQKLTSALGRAEAGIDARIGRAFHELAKAVKWAGHELQAQASLLLTIATLLTGTTTVSGALRLLGALRHELAVLRAKGGQLLALAHRIELALQHAAAGRIGGVVRVVQRPIAGELRGVERWVFPRVRGLEHELHDVVEPDVAALRARARAIEQQAIRAFELAKGAWRVAAVGAVTAAVAVALQRLGLGWVKCRNVGRVGRSLCGFPSGLLDGLLEGAIDVLVVADLCELVSLMSRAAREFEGPLLTIVGTADALIGCRGATKPAPLRLNAVALVPPTAPLAL